MKETEAEWYRERQKKKDSLPKDPDRSQSSRQHSGREGGGEDEARPVAAHHVHEALTARDVPTDVAKSLTYKIYQNDV